MLRFASLGYGEIHTPLFKFCLTLSRILTHIIHVQKERIAVIFIDSGRQILTFYPVKMCSINIWNSVSRNLIFNTKF